MATIEDRFNAAVNVIKNLPKNGSYQPSNAMMLTFYSYFKQATEGPCTQKKPNFFDVVRRAKWDAWHALGNMSKERAMHLYVEELKKIIETMSYTENVANFMGSISELENVSIEDLEAVAPEIMKMARSNPNSPFASRGNSPQHSSADLQAYANGTTSNGDSSYVHQNGYSVEQSDDEYIDTVEDDNDMLTMKKQRVVQNQSDISRSDICSEITRDNVVPVLTQILSTLQRMNTDLSSTNQKVTALEKHVLELRSSIHNSKLSRHKYPKWWPFDDISPAWLVFLIVWPFLAQRVGRMLQRRK